MNHEREPLAESAQSAAPPVAAPAQPGFSGFSPAGVLSLQRTAGNAAVARAVLARAPTKTKPKPPGPAPREDDEERRPRDVFAGKSYDFKTKAGALEHIKDWHTQLLTEYTAFMGREVLTSDQLEAGRAFFIYSTHYQPKLEKDAESRPPIDVVQATIKAVNDSHAESKTEEAAAQHLKVADYRQLFPEHHAREYEAEAARLRKAAEENRDQYEQYKVKAAAEGNRKSFVDWSEYQTYEVIAAKRFEQEAAQIRKGHFAALRFKDHKPFFEFEARDEARKAADKEWDVYVKRAGDTRGTWEKGHEKQWAQDTGKQGTDAAMDLVAVEVFAVKQRLDLGAEVLPKPVVEAWRVAELALTALNPAIQANKVPKAAQDAAADAVLAFYQAFRAEVAALDVTKDVPVGDDMAEGGTVKLTTNPYLGDAFLQHFAQRLRDAKKPEDWRWPVDQYRNVVSALDRYVADKLAKLGRKAEGEQLKSAGTMAKELAKLLERKKDVQKVRAVFYPRDKVTNVGQPGTPDFRAQGIPLYFYLYREDDEWHLADVTTPQQVKVTAKGGGTATTPPQELFAALNTKLRFPYGRLYWQLPGDASSRGWTLETNEPWRLSEWLTWIGLAAGAVALGFLTFGASVPASVIVVGGLAGAGAAAADWAEKSEAGVITTKDIVVDSLAIVGNLFALGAYGLGRVAATGALKTGAYARLAVLADQWFVPVTLTAVGADVASFMILLDDAKKQLEAVDKMEGSESDRKLARARLVGQLLMAGTITLLSVKGSLPGIRRGQSLYLDTEPNGRLIARPTMSNLELAKAGQALKSPEAVTELLKRGDLSKDMLDRLRAGISQALSVGPVERGKLEELLARLRTAPPGEVQGLLGELTARSRVGAYLGAQQAGAMSPATATGLNALDTEALMLLRGSSARELDAVAKLVAQDAVRANALLKEFGPAMVEQIRFNPPLGGLDKLEKTLADTRKQKTERVPGFFEGIDPHGPPPEGLTFQNVRRVETKTGTVAVAEGAAWPDVEGVRVIETRVHGKDGATGLFERAYDPKTGAVQMRQAYTKAPGAAKAIPGKVTHAGQPMLDSGSPTVQYVTLYQFKQLGVPARSAAVKQIVMQDIENLETIMHLHWLEQQFPGVPAEELIGRTASVKYARTSAIQSGYEPMGTYKLTPGKTQRIGVLLDALEGAGTSRSEADALLKKYGATRDTPMRTNFDISFPVRPQ